MTFADTAALLAAVLTILNLALIVAVLRRLAEHEERLARLNHVGGSNNAGIDTTLKQFVGQRIPEFSAQDLNGRTHDRKSVTGTAVLIGFFAHGCKPCHEQAPTFAELTQSLPPNSTFAVVTGNAGSNELGSLTFGDDVVTIAGPDANNMADALGVDVFPTFLRLDGDGTVVQATVLIREIDAPSLQITDAM